MLYSKVSGAVSHLDRAPASTLMNSNLSLSSPFDLTFCTLLPKPLSFYFSPPILRALKGYSLEAPLNFTEPTTRKSSTFQNHCSNKIKQFSNNVLLMVLSLPLKHSVWYLSFLNNTVWTVSLSITSLFNKLIWVHLERKKSQRKPTSWRANTTSIRILMTQQTGMPQA